MTDLIKPDFTRKEAEAHTELILSHANATRWLLLEAFERKAYKALEYTSFEDYAKERLNLSLTADSLSRMVRWAETERNVLGQKVDTRVNFLEAAKEPKLAWTVAEQLSKLPAAEQQREAYEQMQALRQHGLQKPNEVLASLKRIVARMLKGDTAETPAAAPASPSSLSTAHEPTAFETAVQSPSPAKPAAPKPTAPVVSSFTPAADPEPADEFTMQAVADTAFDFEDAAEALQTALTWIENEQVDGGRKAAQLIACTLVEIARWIEQEA